MVHFSTGAHTRVNSQPAPKGCIFNRRKGVRIQPALTGRNHDPTIIHQPLPTPYKQEVGGSRPSPPTWFQPADEQVSPPLSMSSPGFRLRRLTFDRVEPPRRASARRPSWL